MLTRCKSCQLDYIYRENESTYQPDEQKSQCGRNILHIWSHWSHSSIQSHSINSCFHLSVSFFFFLSIEIWIQTTCSSNSSFSPDKNSSTWFRFGCSKCSRLAPLPVKKNWIMRATAIFIRAHPTSVHLNARLLIWIGGCLRIQSAQSARMASSPVTDKAALPSKQTKATQK